MADAVDLSKLPPEALAQIPAGYPPDGVVSNLVNPPTVGYHILVANSLLMAIMFTFAGLRFYTAIKIKRKFSPDDWATVAALIGSIYYFTIVCMAIVVTKFGTHMWDLSVAHMKTRNMALLGFMSNGPPHLIWPTIKTTFFLMYLQLFRPLAWLRRCVYVGLVVVWLWYLGMAITTMVITAPPPGKGWVESFATPRYLLTFKLTVPAASFSLVSDVYILLLPLVAISHLQMSSAKKIGVGAMFSTGFICCLASAVSVYFQHRIWKNQSDYTYYVVYVYLAYMIEICVGISTSCMPSLARLHRENGPKLGSIASSLGFPFRSLRKTTNNSNNSRLSTIDGYPKKSPYAYMEEESDPGAHEMGRIPTPGSNSALVGAPDTSQGAHIGIVRTESRGTSERKHADIEAWPIRSR